MATPQLVVGGGHPGLLDLPWDAPMEDRHHPRRLDLPMGISRHQVQFLGFEDGLYAVKELPLALARHEQPVLRRLEDLGAPSVRPVAPAERPWLDPHEEASAAQVTGYVEYAFSYRELLSAEAGKDVPNEEAFARWVAAGQPGYPLG